MTISLEDAQALSSAASYVRLHSGLSFTDSVQQVKDARDEYGIAPRTYVRDRLYLLPLDALVELERADRYVALVAEQRASSYGRAFATMYDVRRRYGIGFREFAQEKLYQHADDSALNAAVRRLIEREAKHIQQVCHETGWSFDEAEKRMREAKNRWPAMDFRKYVGYRLAAQTDEEIISRISRWNETAKANREKVAEITGWPIRRVQKHMTRYQILYDIIPAYYMCYRGWELTDEQMDGYARQKLSEILASRLNDRADTELMGRKDKFDEIYAEYVKRKFWVNSDSSFEEFLAFAKGLDAAFCKPLKSGGGLGTFTLDLTGDEVALRRVYDDLMAQPLILVEESVIQHPDVNEFYPKSVNTVRVVTLQDETGTHIISTGARFGSTGITDNFSGDGMVSDVDITTGRIVTPAVDKKGISYDAHPYSGKRFVGFQIPHWEQVIETAKRAMDVLPGVNYVGWDVAIGPDSVSLIEGNSMPDLVLVQAPYAPMKIGKRYLFDPFLEASARNPGRVDAPKTENAGARAVALTIAGEADARTLVARFRSSGAAAARRLKKVVKGGSKGASHEFVQAGLRFRLTDDEAVVVRFEGAEADVVIPASIEGRPVTAIRSRAFEGSTGLARIGLPDSLVTINSYAFAGCTALTAVELPDEIQVLNRNVFDGATALVQVGLPYSLKRIGMESFKDCVSLSSLYYYSRRGISDVMVTDRALREETLPTLVEYIGAGAFENCRSLVRIDIPYLVTTIAPRTFSSCSSLEDVGLHNRLQVIGERTFENCDSIRTLRIPARCKKIGNNAFSRTTQLVVGKRSYAAAYARENVVSWREPIDDGRTLESRMNPGASEQHQPFFSSEEAAAIVERYEIRQPSYRSEDRADDESPGEIPPSRFELDGDVYRGSSASPGRARIMMVGDLMARYRQQVLDFAEEGSAFDASFDRVRDLLKGADFVVGNLESTISPSAPYTREREHVNARPHLNAPRSFLGAIRRAGFDAVTNAQNHAYDSGTRGVLETLDATNECQLMHTGLYASSKDQRFLIVDIGGIRIGIVAYLDSARQMMKKANFTKTGLGVMFPYFDQERVSADVEGARAAGAEFVLAFCHWGREYTADTTERQRGFARMVVEAGADYIVGAHSHCVQPYEVLTGPDGRQVPCLWSAGNFISDINLKPPITRDTVIMDLTLERADDGSVMIAENGYHPCRIMNRTDDEGQVYVVVPTASDLGSSQAAETLAAARSRITEVLGAEIEPVG